MSKRWLLPEGIDDILADEAQHLETTRRRILNLFEQWGYKLVNPPLVEFLESLVAPDEDALLLQTFKLTDQLSGKTLGVRADITPQIARIDAHALNHNKINRLCYCGGILKTRPDSVWSSRAPIQFGAEVYGHEGRESIEEIIQLMLATLSTGGAKVAHLSLGHVGIYSQLAKAAQLNAAQRAELVPLLHSKAKHEIEAYLRHQQIPRPTIEWFTRLSGLYGEASVLKEAHQYYSTVSATITRLFDVLQKIADKFSGGAAKVWVDLAELPAYHYEAGVVFSAFVPGINQEVARGGGYDGVGKMFGRARPAVGFSGDMKLLMDIDGGLGALGAANKRFIFAPKSSDAALHALIRETRGGGDRVVAQLADEQAADYGCDAQFVKVNNQWIVESLK